MSNHRSTHQWCSLKTLFLKVSQYSQENTCFGVLFNEVASLRPGTLLKKTPTQVFCLNVVKLLRTPILKDICEQRLLKIKLNLFKVCKLFRVWLKFTGKIVWKWLTFKWLLLKVHFQTQLRRVYFYVSFKKSYISEWLRLVISETSTRGAVK